MDGWKWILMNKFPSKLPGFFLRHNLAFFEEEKHSILKRLKAINHFRQTSEWGKMWKDLTRRISDEEESFFLLMSHTCCCKQHQTTFPRMQCVWKFPMMQFASTLNTKDNKKVLHMDKKRNCSLMWTSKQTKEEEDDDDVGRFFRAGTKAKKRI